MGFEIPLDLIDTQGGPEFRPATTGSEPLMNVATNEVDEEVNNQTSFGMLWSESRLWSPLVPWTPALGAALLGPASMGRAVGALT
jgi:hypothetical protein